MRNQPMPAHLPPLDPTLTLEELHMLRAAPYESPETIRGTREVKIAQSMIARGLLERDETASLMVVRCTQRGADLARLLSRAAAQRVVDHIADLAVEDPEAAASLERALHHRVLLEGGDMVSGAIGPDTFGKLVEVALSTSRLAFRRF